MRLFGPVCLLFAGAMQFLIECGDRVRLFLGFMKVGILRRVAKCEIYILFVVLSFKFGGMLVMLTHCSWFESVRLRWQKVNNGFLIGTKRGVECDM